MVRALVEIKFALTLWTYEKAKSKLGNAHQRTPENTDRMAR